MESNLTCKYFSFVSESHSSGTLCSQLKELFLIRSMGGSRARIPLASTDFAVPRRPAITIPPNFKSTAANNKANLIDCCPITAVIGKLGGVGIELDIKDFLFLKRAQQFLYIIYDSRTLKIFS